jgi:FkbM family methyltransferase
MLKMLQDMRYARVNSGVARKMLTFFYRPGQVYQIRFGPLRGLRLRYDPTVNFHTMLGLWEMESVALLTRIFVKSSFLEKKVICDVGANLGLYSLFFTRTLPSTSVIYAFEPAPDTAKKLRGNLALNGASNVLVVEQACADSIGRMEFFIGHHHHASSLHAQWAAGGQEVTEKVSVKTTTLDEFFYGQEPRPGPDFIKLDIEGGGTYALRGCDQCIREKKPLLLIESHTPDEDQAISNLIIKHDYQAYRLDNNQWVTELTGIHPNAQGVWGTLLLCPSAVRESLTQVLAYP